MMRALVLSLLLVACEAYESPYGLFEPVPAGTKAVKQQDPAVEATPGWEFPDDELVISSDELGQEPDGAVEPVIEEPLAPEIAVEVASVTVEEPVLPAPVVLPAPRVVQPQVSSAWPISLVATVHTAQPPRAILLLPGGEELVVRPGQLIEDSNIVIMGIGKSTVDVAEISASGDHAVILPRTLHSYN